MKRLCPVAVATAVAGLASAQAFAVGQLADISVTDRSTGEVLEIHQSQGEYWVAGRPGARYAINIRNTQGRRLLAVTSVDGVNVVTGETASVSQNGYVFDPWVSYEISGWRKSDSQIAAFEFTSIPRSYAARTGRPDNVGVIGIALFRESASQMLQRRMEDLASSAAPPAMPAPSRNASERAAAADMLAESVASARGLEKAPSLGTGHGRREDSYVTHVDFEREQSTPNEVIRIRYDSYSNLLAMGVIRQPPAPRRGPQAFPVGPQLSYVPDP